MIGTVLALEKMTIYFYGASRKEKVAIFNARVLITRQIMHSREAPPPVTTV